MISPTKPKQLLPLKYLFLLLRSLDHSVLSLKPKTHFVFCFPSKMRMSCNGCRVLRKGCSENCSIRPCLQWIKSAESQANATVFLAKFYGRAGLMNLLNTGPDHLRPGIQTSHACYVFCLLWLIAKFWTESLIHLFRKRRILFIFLTCI